MLYFETRIRNTKAEWIVLLHGMGGSMKTWGKQVEYYSTFYNVLLIDLHGHGQSKISPVPKTRLMTEICADIIEVLDENNIAVAHFASLSLGTMINIALAGLYPTRVVSMVMGGGVLSFDKKTNALLRTAQFLRNSVPYMWLYHFFATILLPKSNHKKSRKIFAREACKMGHEEFCAWLNFLDDCRDLSPYLQTLNELKNPIPMLYIMGSEDHLFLEETSKGAAHINHCMVHVVEHCGHVCNIEKWGEFNKVSLNFIQSISAKSQASAIA